MIHVFRAVPLAAAAALAAVLAGAAQAQEPGDLERLRERALELVNQARSGQNLRPLASDPALQEAAQAHAADMLENDFYGHVSPEGVTPMDRYVRAGGERWRAMRENISRCDTCRPPLTADDIEQLHRGWMDSPEHRRNILSPGLSHFGFGAAVEEGQGLYAVQTFAGPGQPRDLEAGEEAEALSPEEQVELAVELVNRERGRENVPPIEPSEALTAAVRRMLPDEGLADFSLDRITSPFDALPEAERGGWRSLALLAGECGGCGIEPTAADVRYFVGQWRDHPQNRSRLVDPSLTHLGFALRANGEGRKIALGVLGGR